MQGVVPNPLSLLIHLLLPGRVCDHTHFTEEATEAQEVK